MAERGFRYDVVTPREAPNRPSPLGRDVERIRSEGYQLSGVKGVETPIVDPNREHIAALSPSQQAAYTVALFGRDGESVSATMPSGMVVSTNVGGCLSDTRRALYGDLETWLRLDFIRNNLVVEVQERMAADQQYVDALARWRSCMKQRGFVFERPGDAANRAARAYSHHEGDEPTARTIEMAIAVADAECDGAAALASTTATVAARHEAAVAARHEGDLVAFRELTDRAAKKAKDLLGTSGS